MEDDCPEQKLEFFRAVFREPAGGWLLSRDHGVHYGFLLCPVDPGSRRPGELVVRALQTVGGREWRSEPILSPVPNVASSLRDHIWSHNTPSIAGTASRASEVGVMREAGLWPSCCCCRGAGFITRTFRSTLSTVSIGAGLRFSVTMQFAKWGP